MSILGTHPCSLAHCQKLRPCSNFYLASPFTIGSLFKSSPCFLTPLVLVHTACLFFSRVCQHNKTGCPKCPRKELHNSENVYLLSVYIYVWVVCLLCVLFIHVCIIYLRLVLLVFFRFF